MARAALAAGADGIMVEVHPEPEKALSDGPQSLRPTSSRADGVAARDRKGAGSGASKLMPRRAARAELPPSRLCRRGCAQQ